jgi:hypothetical protein
MQIINATSLDRKSGGAQWRDLCVDAPSWECFSIERRDDKGERGALVGSECWFRELQIPALATQRWLPPASLLIPYLSLTPPLVGFRSTRDMQDLLMIVYTTVFFAVALLYVRACEKLR